MKKTNIFNRIKMSIQNNPGLFLQKMLMGLILVLSVLFFVYSLVFTSNWAKIITDNRNNVGYNFYVETQAINGVFFTLALFLLLVVFITFMFGTMSRKKYYMSNIVLSILVAVFLIVIGVIALINLPGLKQTYDGIDPLHPDYALDGANGTMVSMWTYRGVTKSSSIFVNGIVLAVFMIIVGITQITYTVFKIMAQKERAVLVEKMVNGHE